MKIRHVRVRRYRCLKDLSLDIDDYTALVGPNGSGKSSVLYALDWFFNGGVLSPDDIHATEATAAAGTANGSEIDVEVTFSDLTDEDRRVLGQYGRGETARFRRIWSSADGKEKMIGNSRQGPGFAAIRSATKVVDMRELYKAARQKQPQLDNVLTKDDILAQLVAWENDAANVAALEDVEASDAAHMFGFNGEHVLARRIRLILIPGSTDIAGQVSASGRSNAVSQLIGALMAEAVSAARTLWESDNAVQLAELSESIKVGVEKSTKLQAERVNDLLATLVPNAAIEFVPEMPSWSIKGEPLVQTDVVIDGERRDVSRQGHGVQRAVMISMLQALVPDALTAQAAASTGSAEDKAEQLQAELVKLPALVVCIEEPEIYQHPVRARHFARVLSHWSNRPGSQVLLATHSPYFVLPEQFGSLRRFSIVQGASSVAATTVAEVATAAGTDEARVQRVVEKEIPRTFSEGFFADAVVIVEGDTDRVVLEALAECLGHSLDANGTAILAMGGKGNLKIPFVLLDLIGIPAYIVADGDAEAAGRKHLNDPDKQADAAANHKKATEELIAWLPAPGQDTNGVVVSLGWGDATTVTDRWCVLHDDLETELAQWPEFITAMTTQGDELRSKNVAAVRSAALEADLAGLPPRLIELIEALAAFAM